MPVARLSKCLSRSGKVFSPAEIDLLSKMADENQGDGQNGLVAAQTAVREVLEIHQGNVEATNDVLGAPEGEFTKRLGDKMDMASTLLKGIVRDNPGIKSRKDLAEFINEVVPKAKPYSEGLFKLLGEHIDTDEAGSREDWAGLYAAIAPAEAPAPQLDQTPKEEEVSPTPKEAKPNEPSSNKDLERDSGNANAGDQGREGGVSPQPVADGSDGRDLGAGEPEIDVGDSDGDAAPVGAESDLPLPEFQLDAIPPQIRAPRGKQSGGGGRSGGSRIQTDAGADLAIDSVPANRPSNDVVGEVRDRSESERFSAQLKAENLEVVDNDAENIAATLPMLLPEQHDDVLLAERRLIQNKKRGVLFTNGTGTGKTFTGLGIIKREIKRGKRNILIVVPTSTKSNDWSHDGKKLGLDIVVLPDTSEAGSGITITTYANFRDNEKLRDRDFDLVVYDESHRLMENEKGEPTESYHAHFEVTNHPTIIADKAKVRLTGPRPTIDSKAARLDPNLRTIYNREMDAWNAKADGLRAEIEIERKRIEEMTKAVFLSATPFAHQKNLKYAEGYLYDLPPDSGSAGYNEATGFDKFLQDNFGWRMRTGKLSKPEAGVDADLMEREFAERMMKDGAMSGRAIDVPYDYSREFILQESAVGAEIDRGIGILQGWVDREENKFNHLTELVKKRFSYSQVQQLIESIKAVQAVPRIRQHIALGRKIIVFHSYVNSIPRHPFRGLVDLALTPEQRVEAESFEAKYPELVNLDLGDIANPLELFEREFGEQVVFNRGGMTDNKKDANIAAFNGDNSNVKIFVGQIQATKEGISLHDKTGVHPRVTLHLELPLRPTDAIQAEGRIYRIGQASNATHEYMVLHTNTERHIFGTSEKIRTPENLALGHRSRHLQASFREGYLNPTSEDPSIDQGKGGKDGDRRTSVATPFDEAKSYYYARQKKTTKTKSREGVDYYPTPEPMGFKMTEWLGAKPNEHMMEPSAGHGAIARFFPRFTKNHYIEPSIDLANELRIKAEAGETHTQRFEDYFIQNKFHAIAMNPPFGDRGATAIAHLAKATQHLKDGGRIVAIIPEGPAADKAFDKWYYENEDPSFVKVAEISLPTIMFERAGTSVKTKVIVIDRVDNADDRAAASYPAPRSIEANTIQEFFDQIQDIQMPPRTEPRPGTRKAGEVMDAQEAIQKYLAGAETSASPHIGDIMDAIEQLPWRKASKLQDAVKKVFRGNEGLNKLILTLTQAANLQALDAIYNPLDEKLVPYYALPGTPLPNGYLSTAQVMERNIAEKRAFPAGWLKRTGQPIPANWRVATNSWGSEIVYPPITTGAGLIAGGRGAILQNNPSAPSPGSNFSGAEFNHTKTGEPIFVAKINGRLSTIAYANAKNAASRFRGIYSSFKGSGAIPGFHFKSAEMRDAFLSSQNDNVLGSPEHFETPEFKAWFGDAVNDPTNASKIVDQYGNPKVVFHGTPKQFTVFDGSKQKYSGWGAIGSWFAEDPTFANIFRGSFNEKNERIQGPLIDVYLSIKEPAVYEGTAGFDQLIQDYKTYTGVPTNRATKESNLKFVSYLKGLGFDGITINNHLADSGLHPDPQTFHVAFDSAQIKSSFNNSGQYDSANPDILGAPPAIRFKRSIAELERLAQSEESFKDWYPKFQAFLKRFLGTKNSEYVHLISEFMAATSANTGVKGNVTIMMKALREYIATGEFESFNMVAHKQNLERAGRGEKLSGPKISEFSNAVFGDENAMAIDRHIAQIMFGVDKPSRRQIRAAKTRITKIAINLGWTPRQVQAALWAANQTLNGNVPSSYGPYLAKHKAAIHALLHSDRSGEGRGAAASGRIAERVGEARSGEGNDRGSDRASQGPSLDDPSILYAPEIIPEMPDAFATDVLTVAGRGLWRERMAKWEADIEAWVAAQPENKILAFRTSSVQSPVALVSKNTREGEAPWRVTRFSSWKTPNGHSEFSTRILAVKEASANGTRELLGSDALFAPEPMPEMPPIKTGENLAGWRDRYRSWLKNINEWVAAQPENRPLAFRTDKGAFRLVSKDAKNSDAPWKVTLFEAGAADPVVHSNYATRTEAVKAASGNGLKRPIGLSPIDNDALFAPSVKGTPDEEAAIAKVIGSTADKRTVFEKIQGMISDLGDYVQTQLVQKTFDSFNAVKRLERFVTGTNEHDAAVGAYKWARLTKNLDSVMEYLMKHGNMTYKNGSIVEKKGKGLVEILRPLIESGKLDLWSGYVAAKRADGLLAQGREKNFGKVFDPVANVWNWDANLARKEIDTLLDLATKHPEFETIRQEYVAFQKSIVDLAQAAGLIDPLRRAQWESSDYVPFYRIIEALDEKEIKGGGKKRGLSKQSANIRRLKGAPQKVDIIENMFRNIEHLVDASFKNIAMDRITELADNNSDFLVPKPYKAIPFKATVEEVIQRLEEANVDTSALSPQDLDDLVTFWRMRAPTGKNIVSVMRGGRAFYYEVKDKPLLNAILSLGPDDHSWWRHIIMAPKKALTTLVTLAPPFIAANTIRDTLHSWVIADTQLKPGWDAMRGFAKSLANDPVKLSVMMNGGGTGHYNNLAMGEVRSSFEKLTREQRETFLGSVIDSPAKVWRLYKDLGRASENANRLAIADSVMKRGGTPAEAAFQALDIMDFGLRGDSKALGFFLDTVPFLNARLQGLYRIGRTGNPLRVAAHGAMITAGTLALMARNWDDDRFWALQDWDRDMYYHLWIGDRHVRIPKPFEVGTIFSTLPERMAQTLFKDGDMKLFGKRIASTLLDTFNLNPTPQAIKPILERAMNMSFLTMRPIISMGDEFKTPEQQYNAYTTLTSREIANSMPDKAPEWLRSPKTLDSLIRGYTGSIGLYVMDASDAMIRASGAYPAKPETKIGDYWLHRFSPESDLGENRYVGEFYDLHNDIEKIVAKAKVLRERGDIKEANDVTNANRDLLAYAGRTKSTNNALSSIRKREQKIYADPRGQTPEQRRTELAALSARKNQLAEDTIRRAPRRPEAPFPYNPFSR